MKTRLVTAGAGAAWSHSHDQPPPRIDQLGRLLLGDPGPKCAAALGWHPPQPKLPPRAARSNVHPATSRTATARSSTARRPRWDREAVAAYVAGGQPAARPTSAQEDYSLARARAMRLRPGSYEHCTGGRT